MADYNNNIDGGSGDSSRFEHKSQGMRSRSLSEKKAQEDALTRSSENRSADDKTIKIERTKISSSSAQSPVKKVQGTSSATSSAVKTGSTSGRESPAKTSPEKNGYSVFVNRSKIPAYDIGLNNDDYYIPEEIKSGKVSKISNDQVDEMEAKALKKKKQTRGSSSKKKKKKKTPAQKALKAAIWLLIWIIVFLVAFIFYKITYNVFYDIAVDPDSTTTIEYTVTADATDESVYEDLIELGVIDCSQFIYNLRAKVFDAEYVEGTYTLSDGYNTEKIINILAGYNYSSDDE